MTPKITLRKALADTTLLGNALAGDSWANWRALLLATVGEKLRPAELDVFQQFTGRDTPPARMVDEALFLIGRRGGKDRAASVLAVYLAALCEHPALVPGERGLLLAIAPDQRQAKVQLDYIEGALRSSPVLSKLIQNRTADSIELGNRVSIEVRAASFRRLRGVTAIAVIGTEASFWHSDEGSTNADTEILNAVRPSLATTGGPLILITTPYAKRGAVWDTYRRHFGAEGDPSILVAQGTSRDFNPTLAERVVERALERDRAAAAAEYLAQFREDIESFIAIEVVERCVERNVIERGRLPNIPYHAFVDPSGGSQDAMTLAVAHREGERILIDAIRETKPPFSPESVVDDFAALLKSYGIRVVRGDRYAGEWPREQFRKRGIDYMPSALNKSDLFRDAFPLLNAQSIVLPDNARLVAQIAGLERRTSRGGKDSIDHAPGGHDDLANAVAGAASLCAARNAPALPVFGTWGTPDPAAEAAKKLAKKYDGEITEGPLKGGYASVTRIL